jgi:hypothetical protein
MAELDKTLVEELDEIDALFSRRNHLAPALSVAQISGTLRQLRQQPLPYRSIWHKQPSRVWSLVAVFLAFGFFLISTLVGNVRPSAAMEQLTPAFTNSSEQAMHTPGVSSITPLPVMTNFQTFTIVPAFNQTQNVSEPFKPALAKPQTLPPNR